MKRPRRIFLHLAAGAAAFPGGVADGISASLSDAEGRLDRVLFSRRPQ